MSATHFGHCQACGRRQLLPAGVLARHGYEISQGFQRGVCFGSGHLPYEQSCELIESTIEHAAKSAQQMRDRSAVIAAQTEGRDTWRHLYRPDLSSRGRTVHLWTPGTIEGDHLEATFVYTIGARQERDRVRQCRSGEQIAREGRQGYARALLAYAESEDRYVEQQRRRIAEWAPRELEPRSRAAAEA